LGFFFFGGGVFLGFIYLFFGMKKVILRGHFLRSTRGKLAPKP
jgi:hypothetical protein